MPRLPPNSVEHQSVAGKWAKSDREGSIPGWKSSPPAKKNLLLSLSRKKAYLHQIYYASLGFEMTLLYGWLVLGGRDAWIEMGESQLELLIVARIGAHLPALPLFCVLTASRKMDFFVRRKNFFPPFFLLLICNRVEISFLSHKKAPFLHWSIFRVAFFSTKPRYTEGKTFFTLPTEGDNPGKQKVRVRAHRKFVALSVNPLCRTYPRI